MGLPAEAGICPLHAKSIQRECQRCGDFGCAVCFAGGGPLCSRCAPRQGERVDLASSISRWFNDPNLWSNIAIGAVCFLCSWAFFPMLAVLGYQLRVARRAHDDPRAPLPGWEDPIALMLDGLKSWLATVIPVFAAYLLFGALLVGGMLAFAALAGSSPGGPGPVEAVLGVFGAVGLVGAFFGFLFLWIYLQPALHVHYLRTGSILAGLDVGTIWQLMFARPGRYLEVFLYHLVIGMIAGFVGELACFVGLFVTLPWAFFSQGHLLGLFWRDVEQNEVAP